MSYKIGDKVRIKDFNWYNANKDEDGDVPDKDLGVLFLRENDWCLGKEFIISNVYECIGHYIGKHVYELCGIEGYDFTDYMIDCLVERQNKEITNKELQDLLKQYPDDAVVAIEYCDIRELTYIEDRNLITID